MKERVTMYLFCGFVMFLALGCTSSVAQTPIVMWHGMGDSCCFPFSLGSIKKLLEQQIPGVYVKSLEIGGNYVEDYISGFFIHPNKQIMDFCKQIKNDPKLANTPFHALGFSQGGQFLRGLIQRCPEAQVANLITLGAPHQGVFGLPDCDAFKHKFCEKLREILEKAVYSKLVQNNFVQATYWHDPLHEDVYISRSSYLANINNAYDENEEYAENLNRLDNFVMVKFLNDTILVPKESAHFGFYTKGQDRDVESLEDSDVYSKLGLDQLQQSGKLLFLETEGNHLQFTKPWFIENIIPYLK